MIKEHPLAFVLFAIFWGAMSVAHFCAAVERAKKQGRPWFESTLVAMALFVVWPLFSIGMMFRGYGDFWDKTWGDK